MTGTLKFRSGGEWKTVGEAVDEDPEPEVDDLLDSFWKIDEGEGNTITDSLADRDMTINGPQWDDGRLLFDGLTDDVAQYDNADSYFSGFEKFSYFGWVKPLSLPEDEIVFMSVYDIEDGDRSWRVRTNNSDNISMTMSPNDSDLSTVNSDSVLVPNEWQSVGLSADGDDVRFYHNGYYVGSDEANYDEYYKTNTDLRLGNIPYDDRSFDGYMAMQGVKIGTALSHRGQFELYDQTRRQI